MCPDEPSGDVRAVPAVGEAPTEAELAELETLAAQVAVDGSADLAARFGKLVDILIMRGALAPGHRRLLGKIRASQPSVQLAMYRDKRAVVGADVDCASRLHLCHSRCCSFTVSLSAEDIVEGKLRWNLHEPYVLLRNPDTGYCGCLDGGGGCTVYDERPGTCRAYDCREDPRVWLDFEARIPAPLAPGLVPPKRA